MWPRGGGRTLQFCCTIEYCTTVTDNNIKLKKITSGIFIADGVFSRKGAADESEKELKSRRAAAHSALSILGVTSVSFGDFPDNKMDTVATIDVAQVISKRKPIK